MSYMSRSSLCPYVLTRCCLCCLCCLSGDVASLQDPRPKAGVFAVRAGPPLASNLRKSLLGTVIVGKSFLLCRVFYSCETLRNACLESCLPSAILSSARKYVLLFLLSSPGLRCRRSSRALRTYHAYSTMRPTVAWTFFGLSWVQGTSRCRFAVHLYPVTTRHYMHACHVTRGNAPF